MPDNYMKTRPFPCGSSRESARGGDQKLFFKTESQYGNTKAEMITTSIIETGTHKFLRGNLALKMLPRTDSTETVTKS